MRQLFYLAALSSVLLVCSGSQESAAAPSQGNPSATPDDPTALKSLEASGVSFGRDAAGNVTSVDASGVGSFGDTDIDPLTKLKGLRDVNLSGTQVSNDGLVKLQGVKQLRKLELQTCANISDDGMQHLAALPKLEQVLLLYNSGSITNGALQQLAKIKSLRLLDVRGCVQISDEGVAHLATLPNLVALKLKTSGVTDKGVAHLARLSKLRSLHLESCRVSGDALQHLSGMKELEELNLYGTLVDDEGLAHLKGLSKLKILRFRDTAIAGTGLRHLAASQHSLRRLDLSESFIGDEGLGFVAQFANLETLNLWNGGITNDGLTRLVGLHKLRDLNLEGCDIDDEGIESVAEFTNLESLNLKETGITDESLQTLTVLKQLKSLNLQNTNISEDAAAEFQKALRNCKIRH